MEAVTKISGGSISQPLEVVHSQIIFDLFTLANNHCDGFTIIVNPASFRDNQNREVAIAKVGYSEKRHTLKFFFEKANLDPVVDSWFSHNPYFHVARNFVLPTDLLIHFSLPYHIITKGDYRILQDSNYYYVEF